MQAVISLIFEPITYIFLCKDKVNDCFYTHLGKKTRAYVNLCAFTYICVNIQFQLYISTQFLCTYIYTFCDIISAGTGGVLLSKFEMNQIIYCFFVFFIFLLAFSDLGAYFHFFFFFSRFLLNRFLFYHQHVFFYILQFTFF